jgi:RNA ligase (TIGR02306 family)
MSTHEIQIVKLDKITKHPNADTLGIVEVFGWTCCVKLGEFNEGDLVAYIPPDYVVPKTPQFEFLGDNRRIKVRKLRGIISQGLIIKAPENSQENDDVMELLGIERYEPPQLTTTRGEAEGGNSLFSPKYDVESFQRYPDIFKERELVACTEKIHGASARFTYHKNRMWCGSRNEWKKQDENNLWWKCLKQNPGIQEFCIANPDTILYGEVFGQVQDLKYGAEKNQYFFAMFDILEKNNWMERDDALDKITPYNISVVPLAYRGFFYKDLLLASAEKDSLWKTANHLREGIVIRTIPMRYDAQIGRCILKMVSNRYLMKGEK